MGVPEANCGQTQPQPSRALAGDHLWRCRRRHGGVLDDAAGCCQNESDVGGKAVDDGIRKRDLRAQDRVCRKAIKRVSRALLIGEIVAQIARFRLFAGVVPRVMWISLGGAIFLGGYDKTMQIMQERALFS